MTIRIHGRLSDGHNADSEDVIAECSDDGWLRIEPGTRTAVAIAEIVFSDRVGNIPRTLLFPDGAQFETDENDRIDDWLARCGYRRSWRDRLERSGRVAIIAAVTVGVVMFVGARWGIPALGEVLAERMPVEVDAVIANGALEALDDGLFTESTLPEAEQAAIRDQFNSLKPTDSQAHFKILFRNGGWIGANAFALPDGTIVVTDELIALATNDDELNAVLLHEIGHVIHRHSLQLVIRHSGLAMLSLLILGDVASAGTLVLALPSVLVESAYSREFESEADQYALARMRAVGIDSQHFANLLERLERCALVDKEGLSACIEDDDWQRSDAPDERGGWFRYLGTHPITAERVRRIRGPTAVAR